MGGGGHGRETTHGTVAPVGGHALNYFCLSTHPSGFLVLTSPVGAGTREWALVTTCPMLSMVPGAE